MLTRRELLAASLLLAAAATTSGCTSDQTATVDPALQADHDALVRALETELQLLQQANAATGDGAPDEAVRVVTAHVDELSAAVGSPTPTASSATSLPESPSATVSPSVSPSVSSTVASSSFPSVSGGDAGPTVPTFARSAAAAARSHLASVTQTSGPVARLLASVAASDLALAGRAGHAPPTGPGPSAGRGPLPTTGGQAVVDSWQATLAMEHQAVYGYQAAAARLRAAGSALATPAQDGIDQHDQRRDVAVATLLRLGADPVTAKAAYALPHPLRDERAVTALLARIERACAGTYADLVAESAPDLRRLPTGWLVAAAWAETRWSGRAPSLPGLEGRTG